MAKKRKKGAERPVVVVDAANVAYAETGDDKKPRVANISLVREALLDAGYDPVVIADASLWHEVDEPDALDRYIEENVVRQVPAGTDADYFILETAERFGADVVSNDRFGSRADDHPWIRDRRRPFMIIRGAVEFYDLDDEGGAKAS